MSKPVFVGELRHASGNRLREILGLSDSAYEAIDKINLCTGRWSMKTAKGEAWDVMIKFDRLVLLGAKVRDAFEGPAFFQMENDGPPDRIQLLSLPHPSGRNLLWNQPGSKERARAAMRVFAPELYATN